MKIKRNDLVRVLAGDHKGETATVERVFPKQQKVTLAGIGVISRRYKPNQLKPQGGTREVHQQIDISNIQLAEQPKSEKKKEGKKSTTKTTRRSNK